MTSFDARRKKLRTLVHEASADALLVTSFTNVTYLTLWAKSSSLV